jgi:hypothetical protein
MADALTQEAAAGGEAQLAPQVRGHRAQPVDHVAPVEALLEHAAPVTHQMTLQRASVTGGGGG